MYSKSSGLSLTQSFEAQFEPVEKGGYLYRKNLKGEPIPVSEEERDRFVRDYTIRVRLILGGLVIGLLAFYGVVIWIAMNSGEVFDVAIYAGTTAIAVIAVALLYRVRGAPARALEGRASVGRAWSREEMRAVFFSQLTYPKLALSGAAGVFVVLVRSRQEDVLSGWNRLWLVMAAALVLLAAVQAFRKWRFERERAETAA